MMRSSEEAGPRRAFTRERTDPVTPAAGPLTTARAARCTSGGAPEEPYATPLHPDGRRAALEAPQRARATNAGIRASLRHAAPRGPLGGLGAVLIEARDEAVTERAIERAAEVEQQIEPNALAERRALAVGERGEHLAL